MNGIFNFFKQWLVIVALLIGFVGANAGQVKTDAKPQVQNEYLIDGDTFIPIPWGKETPISWMLLSGSWMLRQGDMPTSYFTFKVLNQNGSAAHVLHIQQMDPKTCAVIGAGMGSLTASNKIIYATLRNAQNREVYRLNLRNFATTSFVKKVPVSYEGTVVMMSVAPINSYNFTHFSMARVNLNTIANPSCRLRLR